MAERKEPDLRWSWIKEAPVHELSAHGREVQSRMATPPTAPPRPSLFKRLRFRLWLSRRRVSS
jgi:hypothetical protein